MKTRVLVPLLAALACLAVAASASAAAGVTGNWSGKTSQDMSAFGLEEPYETNILFRVLRGRLVTVVGEVRMSCGETEIEDAKVQKSYEPGRGPRIDGGFAISVEGVRVSGHLSRATGSGSISAHTAGCSGNGDWSVKRG